MTSRVDRKLTQDERTALSDQRLMDAAIRLIVEKGTAATTLKALGEASGYSRGLVTYRFGTKAGLFKALIKSVSDDWIEILESRVGEKQGASAVLACFDAYFEFLRTCPANIRAMNILHQQACEPGSEINSMVQKVKQRQTWQLRAWISEGQANGSIRKDINADAQAIDFVALHTGLTFLWMLDENSFDLDLVQQQSKQQLQRTLAGT